MLKDVQFKESYCKSVDNIASSFYLPAMRSAVKYDRVSGYFGSTIFIIAWEALKEFVHNGGRMRIVCSPYLSDEDKMALRRGATTDVVVANALRVEFEQLLNESSLRKPAEVLACLVSQGVIDVKIAVPKDRNGVMDESRLFHDKVGVFTDAEGSAVSFRGSMNETFKGLSVDGNIESIDVFLSWVERDAHRCKQDQDSFDALWSNLCPGVEVMDIPRASRDVLNRAGASHNWETLADEIVATQAIQLKWCPDKSPNGLRPRKHQYEALEEWEKRGRRGIFKHATGSGKTYTSIAAIRDALERGEVVVLLVPAVELLQQWKRELQEKMGGYPFALLPCGDNFQRWKRPGVLRSFTQPLGDDRRVVLAVMDTAASSLFQANVIWGEHLFLVADEVHRMGSVSHRTVFAYTVGARLGVSATPERYGDIEGTAAIMNYFGGIVPPEYSLADAIRDKVLTRYYYHPTTVVLTDEEQEAWEDLTKQINQMVARSGEAGAAELFASTAFKSKLLRRARLLKGAHGKVDLALRTVRDYFQHGQRWLVYCEDVYQLKKVLALLNGNGIEAYEFYAGMQGDRAATLGYFSSLGGVLVSIKCLDEGVDIPAATHALILASSKNPREFIQRRGRVLRRAPGKHFAHLYDAIVLPQRPSSEHNVFSRIVEAELLRAIEFGSNAENPTSVAYLKQLALEYGVDFSSIQGEESDDE